MEDVVEKETVSMLDEKVPTIEPAITNTEPVTAADTTTMIIDNMEVNKFFCRQMSTPELTGTLKCRYWTYIAWNHFLLA